MVKRGKNRANMPETPSANEEARAFEPAPPNRLAEVINDYPSTAEAAEAGGISVEQVRRYLRGASEPSFEVVARLAAGRGFSLDWVWSGRGAKHIGGPPEENPEMVHVPILDIRAGAGAEQWVLDEAPISSLALPRRYLLRYGIRPHAARLMFGIGTSMEPTIKDGSPLVVDTSDLGERDDIYVIRRGHGILVKRLQHLANGSIILKSDNPSYTSDTLPRDDADDLKILGRVGLVLQSI
jgi:transcriptional regulator with XRE-family HTH domain